MLINRNYFERTKWKSLNLEGTITVMKNSLEGHSRFELGVEKISKCQDQSMQILQSEEREKMKENKQLQRNVEHQHMCNKSAKRRGKTKQAEKLLQEYCLKISNSMKKL